MNYKSLWNIGEHKDLSKWIALLSRFNNGNPLSKGLITKVEDFFEYYWENNRLSAINSSAGERFMSELPMSVQIEIYVDYLFSDFLFKYRFYFRPKKIQNKIEWITIDNDNKHREFLVDVVKFLEPRIYKHSDNEMIQEQYEEIFEVIYI